MRERERRDSCPASGSSPRIARQRVVISQGGAAPRSSLTWSGGPISRFDRPDGAVSSRSDFRDTEEGGMDSRA